MKTVTVHIDGRMLEGQVVHAGGTLWIHLNGETYTFENARREGRSKRGTAGAVNPGEIVAPMPGKIIKVLVEPLTEVKSGDVLLVMEAMKMEYTLKAQADGVVSSVACTNGEQVSLGQLLVKLEVA